MNPQNRSAEDHIIDEGIHFLRSERTPEFKLKTQTVSSGSPVWLRLSASAAAIALSALILTWPKTSAAESLKLVLNAEESPNLLKETVYSVGPNGVKDKLLDVLAKGSRERIMMPNGNESIIDKKSNTLTTWMAAIQMGEVTNSRAKLGIVGRHSLASMIDLNRVSSIRISQIQSGSRRSDVYQVSESMKDGRGEMIDVERRIVADAETHFPMSCEIWGKDVPHTFIEWSQPALDDSALNLSPEKLARVVDLQVQREQVLASLNTSIDQARVGESTITLHSVIVDGYGSVVAIYGGGSQGPGMEKPQAAIRIDGLEGSRINLGLTPPPIGNGRFPSARVAGRAINVESAKFESMPNGTFQLSFPIWKTQANETVLKGYATFRVSDPIRTTNVGNLLSPDNLSIFQSAVPKP
jgi:hypothetical protein